MIPERRGTRPFPVTFKLVRWLPTHLEGFTSQLKVRGSFIGLLVRCVHDLLKKWVTGAQHIERRSGDTARGVSNAMQQCENAHDHRGGQDVKNVSRISCIYTENPSQVVENSPRGYKEDIHQVFVL
jgi:hypothetical protein